MSRDADERTETSPLLARGEVSRIEPSAGTAPEAPLDHSTTKSHGTFQSHDQTADLPDEATLEQQSDAEDSQKEPPNAAGKAQLKTLLPALAIGIFLSAADQTLIVSSYGQIGSELEALNLTSWIATAYFLTLTSFQPLYGKLSDIFGRKACLLFAYAVFGIGCLCCGLAQTMQQLIAARAFAGIGAGGMTTVVSILISDIVALRDRGQWQGYLNLIFAAGSSSGAPLGGLLADTIGWRWSFLGQAPLCLVAFIAVQLVYALPPSSKADWRQKLRRIDFLGAAILITAIFTLLLALDRGSNTSWRATSTLLSLSLSLPLFLLFIYVETRLATEPFAPGHIIFSSSMLACYLCNFFSFAGYMALLFYIPLYFQAVDNLTATAAGIRLIPAILSSVTGSLAGGYYMKRTGKYYWLTVTSYTFLVLGTVVIVLASGPLTSSTPLILTGLCIAGFTNGIGVTSTLIGLIANATPADQAIATACSYLFRSLGSTFGVSMSATVANQSLRQLLSSELPKLGLSRQEAGVIAERVRMSLGYVRTLEPAVREVVVGCYRRSTNGAFVLQAGLVAGAAVAAWFVSERALE